MQGDSVAWLELVDRAARLAGRATGGARALLGICGAPGAGKSTLAWHLAAALNRRGVPTARVPMDGFHLADATLAALDLKDRKGAIETFDAWGYLALLRRLARETDHTVYAPEFERTLEQPLAGALTVEPATRLVITEGNYLLAPGAPWDQVRAQLAEVWHVALPERERRQRLIGRHVRFGKDPEQALAWVAAVDDPNAERIEAWRGRADTLVQLTELGLPPARD
jgi:pantothenate kinase